MQTKELKIQGMTCGHCVGAVNRALGALDGVKVEQVRIGSATVSYDDATIREQDIADAIEDAGYRVSQS